ncbi:uncharacterized protein LOC144744710 [Ciona intestinalis]
MKNRNGGMFTLTPPSDKVAVYSLDRGGRPENEYNVQIIDIEPPTISTGEAMSTFKNLNVTDLETADAGSLTNQAPAAMATVTNEIMELAPTTGVSYQVLD